MPPHPLTNFEIQKYQNEPKLNGAYWRNNLSKIKDGAYIMNLDYESTVTYWIALYLNDKNVACFVSFRLEHIPKKKLVGNKNIKTNIYRIQAYDSVMCGYFWIGFIDFLLKGKSLLEYRNLFSPNDH